MTGYKKYLQSLCDERVIMTGYQFGDAYRQLSCHCLFFVLPSGIDGTRPVLLDQMGFGNCVVVRNTPANMEVIGDSGLWFDKNRPAEALAEQIERLTGDHSTVKHFRQKALARARDAFSWERTTDQYEALFHRMLAEKRQKR
jgi:glycosyltransferase involved in cell wall biosynthesis